MAAGTATAPATEQTAETTREQQQSDARDEQASPRTSPRTAAVNPAAASRDDAGHFASRDNGGGAIRQATRQAAQAEADAEDDADPESEEGETTRQETQSPARSRDNSAIKSIRDELTETKKELAAFKRREEEARRAKMTEEEKAREELELLRAENAQLKVDTLRREIGAEFRLKPVFVAAITGTDEESMRAHAAEMARNGGAETPRIGRTTDPVKEQSGPPTYTREQLRSNPKLAAEIMPKYRRGEVIITD